MTLKALLKGQFKQGGLLLFNYWRNLFDFHIAKIHKRTTALFGFSTNMLRMIN